MDGRAQISWRRSLMEYMKFCLEYCQKYIFQVTWVVTATVAFLTSCLPFIGFFSLLVFVLGGLLAVPLALFVFSMAFISEVQDLTPHITRPLLGFFNYVFLSNVCKVPVSNHTRLLSSEQNKDIVEQFWGHQNWGNMDANSEQILEDWNCSSRGLEEEVEDWNCNEKDSEEEVELEPLDSSSSSVCSTSPFSSKQNYDELGKHEAESQQFGDCNYLHIIPSKGNMNMKMDGWNCKESMRLRKDYYRELRALRHTALSEYERYKSEDDEWQPTQFCELLEFWRRKEKNWTQPNFLNSC